ncbi:hypothetical protein GJU40_01970 [Bacillus lacus]|uniref:Isoprenylcysteine carboxyl methyltransferase n=1 Tax=Metabacillus lacus TaxID=1983721 RepID=A0A7X2IWG2_9BACI|nr:isoprenylcysteine carboxylmethyltransferase family protein [Metabacillus lacus]MRX70934.1 hypothetical protein [Metabacillus lacus]
MTLFYIVISLLIIQRITELIIAKRNEKWVLSRGGVEHGREHYYLIVTLHVSFLLALVLETTYFSSGISPLWPVLLPLIILTQIIRYWAIASLGYYWNTRIIIIPDHEVVSKGPYQFMRHPNYVVVAAEILFLPLLFSAYATAILFSILNAFMMLIRIPAEEKALRQHTNYQKAFTNKRRFLPK